MWYYIKDVLLHDLEAQIDENSNYSFYEKSYFSIFFVELITHCILLNTNPFKMFTYKIVFKFRVMVLNQIKRSLTSEYLKLKC
jgi:hypothetical protein